MPRRAAALAALLLLCPAVACAEPPGRRPEKPAGAAPQATPRKFVELRSGAYVCVLSGMLCTACAGMVEAEVRRVDGVEAAEVDFEEQLLRVVIKPRRTVRVDNIKRALARATRRIDLGTSFALGEIRYVP